MNIASVVFFLASFWRCCCCSAHCAAGPVHWLLAAVPALLPGVNYHRLLRHLAVVVPSPNDMGAFTVKPFMPRRVFDGKVA